MSGPLILFSPYLAKKVPFRHNISSSREFWRMSMFWSTNSSTMFTMDDDFVHHFVLSTLGVLIKGFSLKLLPSDGIKCGESGETKQ